MSGREPGERRRRGIAVPLLATLMALTLLLGLGVWQLNRKAWKEGLIAALTERLAAPARPLPPREQWPHLDPKESEFRRVAFPAEFLHEHEALVYSVGSALRRDVAGPGYWVLTPARLSGGSLVMINRGFVPEDRKEPRSRADGLIEGLVDIVGVLRWPEPRGLFTPADDPGRNIWFIRDHLAVAAAKNLGPVAPFYVEQEAPAPPGGLPRVGALQVNLPNKHLQYAVTWFGLALTLVAVFGFWAFRRRQA